MAKPRRIPTFLSENVQPPSTWPLFVDEDIIVTVYNSYDGLKLKATGRVLTPTGEVKLIHEEWEPTSGRAVSSKIIPVTPGYLLSFNISGYHDPSRGRTFVSAHTRTRGYRQLLLFADWYTDRDTGPGWPGGRIINMFEGRGWIYTYTGTDRPAGAQISETVPTNATWDVKSIRIPLTTDGTVVDRTFVLIIRDENDNEIWRSSPTPAQGANLTRYYLFLFADREDETSFDANGYVRKYIPPKLSTLREYYDIVTVATNFQAGDNYAAPLMLIEEWLDTTD